MKSRSGTYVNAVLLILVFSMSTVISFACTSSSVFHQMHHHSSSEHSSQPSKDHNHSNPSPDPTGDDQKSDCCSNYLVEWEKVEKYASRTVEVPMATLVPVSIIQYSDLFHFIPARSDAPPGIGYLKMLRQNQSLRIFIQTFRI